VIQERLDARGTQRTEFRDADHPYADDLDLFGPGSLFQLLSLCRTPMGEVAAGRPAARSLDTL
jgi:hypothetical protein